MKNKFACAFNGLAEGWKHRSVRIQYILALLAVTAGMIMRLACRGMGGCHHLYRHGDHS